MKSTKESILNELKRHLDEHTCCMKPEAVELWLSQSLDKWGEEKYQEGLKAYQNSNTCICGHTKNVHTDGTRFCGGWGVSEGCECRLFVPNEPIKEEQLEDETKLRNRFRD